MNPVLLLHTIAQSSALRIMDSLGEGTVIGGFAVLLLRLDRWRNAGVRFAAWFTALMAIAIVPVAGWSARGVFSPQVVSRAAITVPDSWALYLFGVWAVIAGWFLVGVGNALWHLHALRKSCTRIDSGELSPLLQETLRRTGSRRKIELCTSDEVRVPTAIGLVRPAVVIPRWAFEELSEAELNQVFLHELAHLRRWDDWTNLLQQIVKAVLFFHPAIWWIERKVALEREMACDDAVLAETASPRAYAECLAHLAERSFVQRSIALAQAALGRMQHVSDRVAKILDMNRGSARARNGKPDAFLIAAFSLACAGLVSRAPRLVAFQSAASSEIAAHTAIDGPTMVPATMRNVNASMPAVRPTNAKLSLDSGRHNVGMLQRASTTHSPIVTSPAANRVHLAAAEAVAPAFTETFFVVIDDGQHRQLYQIQMWHVMVLHEVVQPTSKTPRKET